MGSISGDGHSVAITGLSCRFPGDGDNLDNFWESICRGRSAWSEIPEDRFNVDAFHSHADKVNTSITRGAHFLKQDITKFDANFFSFSKAEADSMDPQHRMMIEVAYEAMENAGLSLQDVAGSRTGVFVGHFTSDYRELIFKDPEAAPTYTASGTCKTSLANRISWLFDLQGPSFSMDTACSSSLVALHLACQSLRTGESDIAIVGGVNLLLNPEMFMYFSNQHFLSPDGKCKSFDVSGNGYGRGEGVAALVLKCVDDAVAMQDPIRAVIRGTGSNQDGHTKGFTLPSADAQANLIRDTYRAAGIGFEDTHYVEAHGTGTQAGDVEETTALSKTISSQHSFDKRLVIGSVKANIGHLEACAGLAGVVKSVLILEYGMIPPNIHYKNPNPKIKFDEWNLEVPITLTPWPTSGLRRVSVNSFGYGGTNAHAVLDDAYHYLRGKGLEGKHYTDVSGSHAIQKIAKPPGSNPTSPIKAGFHESMSGYANGHSNGYSNSATLGLPNWGSSGAVSSFSARTSNGLTNGHINGNGHVHMNGEKQPAREAPRLFCFSASDKDGLRRIKDALADHLALKLDNPSLDSQEYLSDLSYTLSRKTTLQWRSTITASSIEQLSEQLRNEDVPISRASGKPRIGFIFTGQGAQWPRMGAELMEYPVFRQSVKAADQYLRSTCDCPWSAEEELLKGKSSSRLHLAEFSQTLCTVLQVATVDLLKTWKITPVAVAGHSSGEMGAAYCLGALSREDAWKAAYYRGVLSTALKSIAPELSGSMMAAGLSPEKAEEWISQIDEGEVVVACVNSPSSVTISGDTAGIDALAEKLTQEGIFARKLKVDTAYHSPHMQIVAQDYLEAISDIQTRLSTGKCRMHSSVTGRRIEPNELGAVNWVRNLTSPVQFAAAVYDMIRPLQGKAQRAEENAIDLFIEIGPHSALQGPATQTLKAHGIMNVPYISVLKRDHDGRRTAQDMAGDAFSQGGKVDVVEVNGDGGNNDIKLLVDLPAYVWSHSQTYWMESRISKEYRHRKQPRMGLIGAPAPSFAQGEYMWRKFIKLSEESWIADHQIQNSIVYPGAGFLAMAFEAAHQIADPYQTVAGFRLRDVQLTAAAVISEDSDLEIMVHLRPHFTGTRDNASTWLEFVVSSSPDAETLQRNCSGLLIIEYEPKHDSNPSFEKQLEAEMLQTQYLEAASSCKRHISAGDFYQDLTTIGLIYGPLFTNMTDIRCTDGKSFCAIDIPETPMKDAAASGHRPHVIHPGTLDAMFHSAFAAIQGVNNDLKQAMVPRAIDEVFISANIPWQPKTRLSGYSNADKHGFKELQADIMMFAEEDAYPVVKVAGFTCTEIGSSSSASDNDQESKKLCSKITWKPAIELLSTGETEHMIKNSKDIDSETSLESRIGSDEAEAFTVMRELVDTVKPWQVSPTQKGFWQWVQAQKDFVEKSQHPLQESINHALAESSSLVDQENAKRNGLKEYMTRMNAVLTANEAALAETSTDVQNSLYMDSESLKSLLGCCAEYLRLLHFTTPGLSILEISRTDGNVRPVSLLKHLTGLDKLLETSQYTLGHQNGDAMANGQGRLSEFGDSVEHVVFDADKPLETQDLKDRKFDLVLAFDFANSTTQPETALGNVKKLLNEGGKVLTVEITNPGLYLSMLSETVEPRDNHLGPVLARNSLEVGVVVGDVEDLHLRQAELRVVRAVTDAHETHSDVDVMVIEPPNLSARARAIGQQLWGSLRNGTRQISHFTWGSDVSILKDKACISLLEVEQPLLDDLDEKSFAALKTVITEAKELFWVVGFDGPSSGMVSGLARVIRNEIPGISFRTLHADLTAESELKDAGSMITRIFESKTSDDEFKIQEGIISVSRIEEDNNTNGDVQALMPNAPDRIQKMPLGHAGGPQKLCVQTPGMMDSLCFEPDDLPQTELAANQLEIDVKATALNFREIMVVMGQIPDKLLGFDAAGVVHRVGSDVTKFKIGDRVAMYGHGSHRTVHRSNADFCALIPNGMSFEEAATIPVVHGTAWYGLVQLARVQKGQTILIHAAAGGVGQSAIQIAKHYEMEIFATCGSEVKRKLLRDTYGLQDDHILSSRDLSFAKGIKRMTGGRGVDVVLNSLSGEALRQTWHCIAPFGTFVEIGIKDILDNTELDMRPFLQDATYTFFNLNHIERERPEVMAKIIAGAFEFQHRVITYPVKPLKVYPISEVENAFRLMQAGKHLGKVALTFSDSEVVPVLMKIAESFHLDPKAVYMIVGGFGGLGRSISNMLVDQGARKLCFLSRSGDSSEQAKKLVEDLRSRHVQVESYACDIADPVATSRSIRDCLMEVGPIRGVIQSAMLLRDVLFTNMTYTEWIQSIRPKVQGTWNLHQNLKDLDFFISLSSFAATFGNRGQSNYAAGGAYQDAIAYHRRSLGLHAVTLDVGLMRNVGVLAEKGITESLREWEEAYGVLETELHALLKRCIAGDIKGDVAPQVLTGLATGGSAIAAGISTPFYLEDNARFSIMALTGLRDDHGGSGGGGGGAGQGAAESTQKLVSKAGSIQEATQHITDALVKRVAKMLQMPESEIDTGRFLNSYGVDSLTAIEIVNWALKEVKAVVSVIDIMAGVPITTTARKIASVSALYQGPPA